MKTLSAALLAAFPAISSASDGQIAATSRVDSVVVTASRQAVRVSDVLADVSVIDRERIAQAGTNSLPELLGRQPGISAYSSGGAGQPSGIFIRGASTAQTLILIDGLRFGSATAGGAALDHLSLDQIERIEIVRGPASALYGSDALGGVVQIFTRKAHGSQFDAYAGAGRYGAESYSLGGSGEFGALRASLRASYDKTDGFSAISDAGKQPYNFDPDRDGYRRSSLGGALGWKIADGHQLDLTAQYNRGRSHYDAQDFMTGAPFDAYAEVESSAFGVTLRDRILSHWDSTLRLGSTLDDNRDFAPWNPRGASFRTRQNQIDWQNDVRSEFGAWLLGVSSVRQSALSEGSFDRSRTINGFYAGWRAEFGAHHVQVNVRRDDNSQFGARSTGTLAWGWLLTPDWRLRAAWGTSFRAPSFNDLYYPGYGNSDLAPEKGRNAEVALSWETRGSRASATVYRNRVSNLINSVCDTNWVCAAENVARAELDGLTLTGATEWQGLSFEASADWLRARDPDSDKQLARRPLRQATLVASYGHETWRAGGELKAVGGRYDDAANTQRMGGYGLLNLFGHFAVTRNVQLEARVDNLFDRRYETAWGYGTAGASVFAGVRVSSR